MKMIAITGVITIAATPDPFAQTMPKKKVYALLPPEPFIGPAPPPRRGRPPVDVANDRAVELVSAPPSFLH